MSPSVDRERRLADLITITDGFDVEEDVPFSAIRATAVTERARSDD